MPAAVQAKVLRFLQDQTFERVGGGKSISTRVRVLAATNFNLEQLIADGRFRGDLYYRLKEITIQLPPLRDRTEDIAAGTVIITRDRPECFALSAFAAARRAKKNKSVISHERNAFIPKAAGAGKQNRPD